MGMGGVIACDMPWGLLQLSGGISWGCYSFGWFELLQGEDFVQGRSLSHDHVHWNGEVLFTRGGHYSSLFGIYLLSKDFPLRLRNHSDRLCFRLHAFKMKYYFCRSVHLTGESPSRLLAALRILYQNGCWLL